MGCNSMCTLSFAMFCAISLMSQDKAPVRQSEAPHPRRLSASQLLLRNGYSLTDLQCDPESSWLVTKSEIQNKPYTFLVDSGAEASFFSDSSFKLQQFKVDVFSKMLNIDVSKPRCALNGRLLDFSGIPGLDGIVGARDLIALNAIVDFKHHQLFLRTQADTAIRRNSEVFLHTDGRQSIRVFRSKSTGRLFVDLLLDKRPCRFALDTGSVCNLLFLKSAKRLGYKQVKETGFIPGALGIRIRAYQTCFPRCSLSFDHQSESVPFLISDDLPIELKGNEIEFDFDGVLGAQFCHQVGAAIDFSSLELFASGAISDREESEIEGSWKLTSIATGVNQHLDQSSLGMKFICRGNSLRFHNGEKWIVYMLKTYPHKSPKWIDWTDLASGDMIRGCYEVKGDSLSIALHSKVGSAYRRAGGVVPDSRSGQAVLHFVRE
jgi:uncharacterized protein (TIGR03067 family)